MIRLKVVFLSVMLFSLPVILYCSGEDFLGQLLLYSQLIVLWGLLPFLFRNEHAMPREWSRKSLILTLLVVGAAVVPFIIHLKEKNKLLSTDIIKSSVRMFTDTSEVLLVLGTCLASVFVIAALVKRRGSET